MQSPAAMISCTSQTPCVITEVGKQASHVSMRTQIKQKFHGFVLLGQQPHHLQAYRRMVHSSQRVMLTLGHAVIGHSQDLPGFVSHPLLP